MESTETSVGFQQYWQILKRRYVPALAVFGSVLGLTFWVVLQQKPTYQAEGKLLFKKASPGAALTELGKELGRLTPAVEQSNPLTTEIEIIRSSELLEKAIQRLQLKDEQGKLIKIKDFKKNLTVSPIRAADILTVAYKDKNPKEAAQVVTTLMNLYLENNQAINRQETLSVRQFIEKKLPSAEAAVRQAGAALSIFKEKNKVVNLEEEGKSAVAVIAGLERQVDEAQSDLLKATAQSEGFQRELQMTPQQALAATSLSQSSAVQEALKEYQQVERLLTIEQNRYVDTAPAILRLRTKSDTLKNLLNQQIQTVLGDRLDLEPKNLQLGEMKPKLIEEFIKVEVQRQGLAMRVETLSEALIGYKQRVQKLPSLEKQQRDLARKLAEAELTYNDLQKKLQEIRLTETQQVGNVRIIQRATPPEEPVRSRKSLFLVAGACLGSLLAVATALLLETQDRSIKTVEEAKSLFPFTLLGIIPYQKATEKVAWGDSLRSSYLGRSNSSTSAREVDSSVQQVIARNHPHNQMSAAYRMLQANLRFLRSDKELKTIVVSSSLPEEGKSTVAANLAVIVAQLGRKVLLIDADMHTPAQHNIWGLPNQLGLSHVIVGEAELGMAITPVMDNLDVLTCGVIPPNPIALLDSQRLTSLLNTLATSYDLVLIDAPALNVFADALIVGKKTDGMLFVVRPGVLDSGSGVFAKELLEKSGQSVLGIVVNGITTKNQPHNQYYFTNKSYSESQSVSRG